jgi:FkbM family methyltransferase
MEKRRGKRTYAQCGEDIVLKFLFKNYLKNEKPSYLDIGAHHPTYLSNTYIFYKENCYGVCVEPDPSLYEYFSKKRPLDVNLNVGVGLTDTTKCDFYVMSTKTLNTFSREQAEQYQKCENQKIERVIELPLWTVNSIIDKHFDTCPNLISIDIEGLDYEVLTSIDLEKYRPNVICVETLTYSENNTQKKLTEISDYLLKNDYLVYADTYINTIFVDQKMLLRGDAVG